MHGRAGGWIEAAGEDVAAAVAALLPGLVHRPLGEGSWRGC